MIKLLYGANSFEVEQALAEIIKNSSLKAEKYDGQTIMPENLPDLLCGATLFSDKRLIIVRYLSENKVTWPLLADILPRLSDDTQLVLVERALDKRTTTYKKIVKLVDIQEFKAWDVRDTISQTKWLISEAKRLGVTLTSKTAQFLLNRVGPNQWQLIHALEKLALVDDISIESITDAIDTNLSENVFNLLEVSLRGEVSQVEAMIQSLELSQDPYQTFGLLVGQVFLLAALKSSDQSSSLVARDLGVSPFSASKLVPYAKKMTKVDMKRIIGIFTQADDMLKNSSIQPWQLIKQTLIKISAI
jgi:DNA polymerase III delta subunit